MHSFLEHNTSRKGKVTSLIINTDSQGSYAQNQTLLASNLSILVQNKLLYRGALM